MSSGSSQYSPLEIVAVDPASRAQTLVQVLTAAARDHAPAAFASSLSAEDMVIADAIFTGGIDIEIFTLDTGRLHGDTLDVLERIRSRYGREVRVYTPDPAAVSQYVAIHGLDAFYESTTLRRECCRIRKIEPLARALAGKNAWITGLRRVPGARDEVPYSEYDPVHRLVKVNPLAEWTEPQVWEYLRERDVPYNRLYTQGYRSIGCAPCTRPTVAGEDVRAGRWWWEQGAVKECGLHVNEDGRLARTKEVV
jgi:phosphoadenosine phosphosulfate reductase